MKKSAVSLVLLSVVLGTMLGGCAENKFTRARYETLYKGMPSQEVVSVLGEPKARFSDTWTYQNDKPFYKAVIQFKNDRVSDRAWYDERQMGTHPDVKTPPKLGGSRKTVTEPKVD